MKKLNVLLVCGSGASSGFMAANVRKAAIKKNIEIDIKAKSEAEIENYIDSIDILLVAPHLKYILEEIEEHGISSDVKIVLIKKEHYATLDGESVLEQILEN